jgi:RNA polymerase sigma factor (sigma-70 family)
MPPLKARKKDEPSNNVELAAEVFSAHREFILAVIRSQVGNDSQANDLFQDFFLSLVSKPVPPDVRNIKSYLYRAIINDIVDAARRVETYKTLMHKYAEFLNYSINKHKPKNALIETEEIDKMFNLLRGQLPRSEAQAITYRFKNNFSIKEVAKKMDVNSRSVSRYISAGLSKVRQLFNSEKGQ